MIFSGCRWCGNLHGGEHCPRVRAIEFFENGTVKRVEFRDEEDEAPATLPFVYPVPLKVVPLPSIHDDNLPDPQFDVRCGSD
jgi:hypothetical protein